MYLKYGHYEVDGPIRLVPTPPELQKRDCSDCIKYSETFVCFYMGELRRRNLGNHRGRHRRELNRR